MSHPRLSQLLLAGLQVAQDKHMLLACSSKMAQVGLKRVFGRLHVDEDKRQRTSTMRPYARVISKIAFASSLTVVDYIIKRVPPLLPLPFTPFFPPCTQLCSCCGGERENGQLRTLKGPPQNKATLLRLCMMCPPACPALRMQFCITPGHASLTDLLPCGWHGRVTVHLAAVTCLGACSAGGGCPQPDWRSAGGQQVPTTHDLRHDHLGHPGAPEQPDPQQSEGNKNRGWERCYCMRKFSSWQLCSQSTVAAFDGDHQRVSQKLLSMPLSAKQEQSTHACQRILPLEAGQ